MSDIYDQRARVVLGALVHAEDRAARESVIAAALREVVAEEREADAYIRTLEGLVRDSLSHMKFGGASESGGHIFRRAEDIGINLTERADD